ncbi:unnamed protein product [Caenorhabditis auriculariae]|uniref:Uncharacterized protein n=1 Tax=Caenorhabditis auriculariae TaxID=2777116 RepID=A0A8S1HRZ9_9PELO|nr:unnamed protein product [Caenorhabditis auriculariae]
MVSAHKKSLFTFLSLFLILKMPQNVKALVLHVGPTSVNAVDLSDPNSYRRKCFFTLLRLKFRLERGDVVLLDLDSKGAIRNFQTIDRIPLDGKCFKIEAFRPKDTSIINELDTDHFWIKDEWCYYKHHRDRFNVVFTPVVKYATGETYFKIVDDNFNPAGNIQKLLVRKVTKSEITATSLHEEPYCDVKFPYYGKLTLLEGDIVDARVTDGPKVSEVVGKVYGFNYNAKGAYYEAVGKFSEDMKTIVTSVANDDSFLVRFESTSDNNNFEAIIFRAKPIEFETCQREAVVDLPTENLVKLTAKALLTRVSPDVTHFVTLHEKPYKELPFTQFQIPKNAREGDVFNVDIGVDGKIISVKEHLGRITACAPNLFQTDVALLDDGTLKCQHFSFDLEKPALKGDYHEITFIVEPTNPNMSSSPGSPDSAKKSRDAILTTPEHATQRRETISPLEPPDCSAENRETILSSLRKDSATSRRQDSPREFANTRPPDFATQRRQDSPRGFANTAPPEHATQRRQDSPREFANTRPPDFATQRRQDSPREFANTRPPDFATKRRDAFQVSPTQEPSPPKKSQAPPTRYSTPPEDSTSWMFIRLAFNQLIFIEKVSQCLYETSREAYKDLESFFEAPTMDSIKKKNATGAFYYFHNDQRTRECMRRSCPIAHRKLLAFFVKSCLDEGRPIPCPPLGLIRNLLAL